AGRMAARPVVSVVRASEGVAEAVGRAGLADVFEPGQRVTIKPNWHGGHGFTSPEVVVAAARYVRGRGAREVVVGDGPFYGKSREENAAYVDAMGVRGPLAELGARVADFHDEPFALRRDLSPDLPETVGFSTLATDCDVLVNLPVMKTHFGTLVTLGMKNLKGCLRPEDKAALHQLELHAALVALNGLLQPAVHLLDATTAYEGLGPGNAAPVDLGLLLCSDNAVALDAVAASFMGIEPRQVKLLAMAAKAGLGPARLEDIEVRGERLEAHRRAFELPFVAFRRKYPSLALCHEHACSGCLGNFFSALAFAGQPPREDYPAIQLGRGHPPAGSLLIGDCARRRAEGHPSVPGCPPKIADIMKAMTGQDG
ncbi:MAG: DUF362 domain-containing protein, partial [Planctomycetota bacterium]